MAEPTKYDYLAEELVLLFSGGDPSEDSTLDIREARLIVEQVHANLLRNNYFENLRLTGQHGVNGAFTSTFVNLPVVFDKERLEHYSVLPKAYINLPNNKGLDEVWEYGKLDAQRLMIVRRGFNVLFDGLRSQRLENRFGVYPEGTRIYYTNKTGRQFTLKAMNVRLVHASPENVSPDQDITILAEATKLLAARRQQDKQNDGNPIAV